MRLIDADALKADYGMKDNCKDCEKELKGYVRQCEYDAVYTKMDFCGWIDSMPTIEPETEEEAYERGYTAGQMAGLRKTGKWIPAFDGKFRGGAYWFNCSKCGHMVAGVMSIKRFNYCPNCGLKMEGAEPEDIPMEYFESGGR